MKYRIHLLKWMYVRYSPETAAVCPSLFIPLIIIRFMYTSFNVTTALAKLLPLTIREKLTDQFGGVREYL